ncbi:MAG: formylglycine-generating enzyme family protein [Bacteroidota bacterium]
MPTPCLHTPYIPTPYPEMVEIKGGSFMMGSEENEQEQPIHEVQVADFLLGKYPVTNTQFARFLQVYGSDKVQDGEYEGEDMIYEDIWAIQKDGNTWKPASGYETYPVQTVTWYGAYTYCQWLSEIEGRVYRLPSEAEWEYAAREGGLSQGLKYAGSNKAKEVAWFDENGLGITHPVGLKLPNELGLFDMGGNVWEWCADHWRGNYHGAPKDASPWISGGDSDLRVLRGGSWGNSGSYCRVSARNRFNPNFRNDIVGFRVAGYPYP